VIALHFARGQSQPIDSLKQVLPVAAFDQKSEILFKLGAAFLDTNVDSALNYIERAMLYETDSTEITKLFRARGIIMARMNRQSEIAESLEPIIDFAEKQKLNNYLIDIYDLIAISRTMRGEYSEALKWVYKLVPLLDADSKRHDKPYIYNNLGILFYKIRDNARALHYYKIAEQLSATPHPFLLVNKALASAELGLIQEALDELRHARHVCMAFSQKNAMTQLHFAFGSSFIKANQLDSAAMHLTKALAYAKELNDHRMHAETLVYHARIHIQKNQMDSAAHLLKEAEKLTRNNNLNEVLLDVFRQSIVTYEVLKQFESLSRYQSNFIRLKEELYEGDIVRDIALAEGEIMAREHQLELMRQEKEIEIQKESLLLQRWTYGAETIVMVLLCILATALLYRNQEQKRIKTLLDEKIRLRSHELQKKRNNTVRRSQYLRGRCESLEREFELTPQLLQT